MNQCPLCESFVRVGGDTPCYVCGLTLAELTNGKLVAIIPAWLLLDPDNPPFAESGLPRLLGVTQHVIVDFSQIRFINSSGFDVFATLNTYKQQGQLNLVFANVGQNVVEMLRITRLKDLFSIVDDIDEGLAILSP